MAQQRVAKVSRTLFCVPQKAQPGYLGHKLSPRISLHQDRLKRCVWCAVRWLMVTFQLVRHCHSVSISYSRLVLPVDEGSFSSCRRHVSTCFSRTCTSPSGVAQAPLAAYGPTQFPASPLSHGTGHSMPIGACEDTSPLVALPCGSGLLMGFSDGHQKLYKGCASSSQHTAACSIVPACWY